MRTASGIVTQTPGYQLLPGTYKLMLRLLGPSTGGKDGAALSTDSSSGYITIASSTTSTQGLETAISVGAYQGTYSDGLSSGITHPQGDVTVYIPDGGLNNMSVLLTLDAYEPVNWHITGPGLKQIGRVFTTGYYNQEVSGLSADIPIDTHTYENGSKSYFFPYATPSARYTKLEQYVEKKYNTYIQQFIGSYTQKDVTFVGFKG